MSKQPTQKAPTNWRTELRDWLQLLTAILVFISIFFTFFGMIFSVSGHSMHPTLYHGDTMLIQRIGYTPKQGDIVIIRKDGFPYSSQTDAIVKRVIATEGQSVEINYHSNTVTVDGVLLDEPYLNFTNEWDDESYGDDYMVKRAGMTDWDGDSDPQIDTFEVPAGEIFVMGDNRNGSTDSRYAEQDADGTCAEANLGTVDTRYVLGCARFTFFPFNRIQSIH